MSEPSIQSFVFAAIPGAEQSDDQLASVKNYLIQREYLASAYAKNSLRAIAVNIDPAIATRLADKYRDVAVRPLNFNGAAKGKVSAALLGLRI